MKEFIVHKGEARLVCKGTPKQIKEFFAGEIKKYPKITLANYIYLKEKERLKNESNTV